MIINMLYVEQLNLCAVQIRVNEECNYKVHLFMRNRSKFSVKSALALVC